MRVRLLLPLAVSLLTVLVVVVQSEEDEKTCKIKENFAWC